jgi:hypothetical protein
MSEWDSGKQMTERGDLNPSARLQPLCYKIRSYISHTGMISHAKRISYTRL